MSYKNEVCMKKTTRRRRSAMLGVLVLGLGGAGMMGACAPSKSGPLAPGVTPPAQPPECMGPFDKPCMRYYIPLLGNPKDDVALRNKYITAFGSACYIAAVTDTFNCFYKTWQAACADAVKIAEVYGVLPYVKDYTCQPVGNGDYSLQVGPDVANKIFIYYKDAPLQSPKIDVGDVPTEANGPYRNLTEPQTLGPGRAFECSSAGVDDNGKTLTQKEWILHVNRKAHRGQVRSDLAGFTYPCAEGDNGMCTEDLVLKDPGEKGVSQYDPKAAQVHHVVPRKDQRSCWWGTNSNKNAAVISRRLNQFLYNKEPPPNEVEQLNALPPYAP